MADPDDTLDQREFTAVSSVATSLETRIDDTPEHPNFAQDLAKRLTARSFINRRLPSVDPHRALTADEAHAWALSKCDGSRFTYPGLLETCWYRLPEARSPQIALSYQRLIHALTTLQAWTDWETGRNVIEARRKEAAENLAWHEEQQALERWRKRDTGNNEPADRNVPNAG